MRTLRMSIVAAVGFFFVGLLAGCSTMGVGKIQEPEVRLMGLEVGDMGLDSAEILFDFEVQNPNARSLRLDGVAYRLRLEGEPLLDGRRGERMEIAAGGESRVTLPMTVRYADVFRAIRTLRNESRPSYELNADFEFDVPVIGTLVVPVNRRGRVSLDQITRRFGGLIPPG